jgi:hypothetical protein
MQGNLKEDRNGKNTFKMPNNQGITTEKIVKMALY